jgi:Ca2+-binding RTX toxin-like protein
MQGGAGNDVYLVDDVGDVVAEGLGKGSDEVRTSLAAYTLKSNVEDLTGTSTTGQALTGNGLANTISGKSGRDVLSGGAGNDTLYGNGGADTLDGGTGADTMAGGVAGDVYVVDNAFDVVIENAGEGTDEVRTSLAAYTLGANLELLTGISGTGQSLTGNGVVNTISGSFGADTLNGGGGNDTLNGNGGSDTLNGGVGADTMAGGLGNDIYIADNVGDVAIENVGEGTDELRTALAAYALAANIEKLTGTSSAGQSLTGNELGNTISGSTGGDAISGGLGDDVLNGNGGNDSLDGGNGADTMRGGAGNDFYIVDDAGDLVTEGLGKGVDEVQTSLATYTVTANVETLSGTNNNGQGLTGNGVANTITGGSGNDMLDGAAGNDVLYGNDGADTISGGIGSDTLWGGLGADSLAGGSSADVLNGEAGQDLLHGDGGNDVLVGGLGRDEMWGGLGLDNFVFSTGDSAVARGSADWIHDFSSAEKDRIDLSAIDADSTLGDDQAFNFIGSAAFGNHAGELHYAYAGGYTYVEGDINGDGAADFAIRLDGSIALSGADFLL